MCTRSGTHKCTHRWQWYSDARMCACMYACDTQQQRLLDLGELERAAVSHGRPRSLQRHTPKTAQLPRPRSKDLEGVRVRIHYCFNQHPWFKARYDSTSTHMCRRIHYCILCTSQLFIPYHALIWHVHTNSHTNYVPFFVRQKIDQLQVRKCTQVLFREIDSRIVSK